MLYSIFSSKYLRLTVAIILVISAGSEVYHNFENIHSFEDIGAHHGVLVFGIFQILQALATIFVAAEYANNN